MKQFRLLLAYLLLLLLPLNVCSCRVPGPEQYFFLNDGYNYFNYASIHAAFGPQDTCRLAVGQAILIYLFDQPLSEYKTKLQKHFSQAEQFHIPILLELDPVSFMRDAPELWNWWDPGKPGFDPANRENVEWSDWGSDNAVRIGWLNWGSQMRILPMINLFSPAYQTAVRERMDSLMTWTSEWYQSLPRERKWLLGGVKITGELAFGINNWYYPDGNKLAEQPATGDPQTGIRIDSLPNRGVGQIGYAALTYMGRKTAGEITIEDIWAIEKEYSAFVASLAQGYGIPRERLFSHSGGWYGDLDAAIQPNTCPSWSFYWDEAIHPANYPQVAEHLPKSDAPFWGLSEWNIGSQPRVKWAEALENAFSIPRWRFISLFNYPTIFQRDSSGIDRPDPEATAALLDRQ